MPGLFDIPEGTDKIAIRKKINSMLSEARKNAKPDKCILFGQNKSSFCNSHSVPQMSLREIASNGIVLHASAAIGLDFEIIDLEKGVNSSGTFNYICRDCYGTFFQDYENPNNLKLLPTDKMLAEIAVKNFLLQISKRAIESDLIPVQQRELSMFENPDDALTVKRLDQQEYESELMLHKAIADNNETGCYQILFWENLPYKVPIAMQSAIALTKDMEGNQINDIFDFRESTRMQYLHLCVFPLEQESIVLAFYHRRDRLYRHLRHQVNSSSKDRVLRFFNYVIFAYTENYFISKQIQSEIETNSSLQTLSQENSGFPSMGVLGADNMFGIGYKPISESEIPNFLSSAWAI